MFQKISEKKKQIDNLISISNGIKKLKSHYHDDFIDVTVNSDFHIETIMIYGCNDGNAIIHGINQCLDDMKKQIQEKTQEILSGNHN